MLGYSHFIYQELQGLRVVERHDCQRPEGTWNLKEEIIREVIKIVLQKD